MPTYTYECKECGYAFDVFHSITANPKVQCTECGGSCKRRLGTGAGIIFKGSGFYETDYKRSGGKPSGSPAPSGESKSRSESKTETKTETKATPKSDSSSASSSKPAKS